MYLLGECIGVLLMLGQLVLVFLLFMVFINMGLGNIWSYVQMKTMFKMAILYLLVLLMLFVKWGEGMSGVIFQGWGFWLDNGFLICFDVFSVTFLVVGIFVSWSIFEFGIKYMDGEPFSFLFLSYLMFFLIFMMLLVLSNSFLFLFIGWEGVGLMSYLLISWWFGRMEAMNNGLQAVIYNRVGDFGLILFLGYLFIKGNNLVMKGFELYIPMFIFVFFFMGVIAKSSQFLFHPWLPNAMEGPTPVSSLLHSSTMVVAGVFLMMRLLMNMEAGWGLVLIFGVLTSLLGGLCAMMQQDMKKIIAYSTTSQLGFMMMTLGLGFYGLTLFYMLMHAFFKAMIFMVSGLFIHGAVNNQDVRVLGISSGNNMFGFFLLILGNLVMMGFPFFSGFWVKDVIIENLVVCVFNRCIIVLGIVSVLCTSIYSIRMVYKFLFDEGISGSKFNSMEIFGNLYEYIRLILCSLLVGIIFLGIFSPLKEEFLSFFLKVVPLALLVFGGVLGGMMSMGYLQMFLLMVASYVHYFNPLWHKLIVKMGFKMASEVGFLDLLWLELLVPRGFGDFMGLINSYKGYFIILMVFIFMM
uniref:NADH dehydrogenase subunit 5 n=1 Tax=Pyura mirabilis TaxID=111863 RepID=UPI002551CDE6|nr:NADH dehydrogenase subunit 5 [Pyura mirabilis]UPP55926.1 NADH dehydrogenase subunit 5 [Pyura mirabilis]